MVLRWVLALLIGVGMARAARAGDVAAELGQAMARTAAAWTAGDLAAFMSGYEDSADTIYIGHDAVVRGRAAIEAMYRERFGAGGSLGALSFETLSAAPLGSEHALFVGRFHLARAGKPEASGVFSLVFHRTPAGWKIVCDHTS